MIDFPRDCPQQGCRPRTSRSSPIQLDQHSEITLGGDTLRHYYNAVTGLSNPFRYPRFRFRASEMRQSAAFAFGVPHDINGFHPYTMSSTDLSHPLAVPFLSHLPG